MPDLSVTHTEPLKDSGDRPHEAVVEELLKYHVRWWDDPRVDDWPFMQQAGVPLSMAQAIGEEDVRDSARRFGRGLKGLAKELSEDLAPEHLELLEYVVERYSDAFLNRVGDGKNVTMLHGDAHVWNLYYPKDLNKDRIILFDWETLKRGLGAYDLAYLLIHGTSGRRKLEAPLMSFYYDRLLSGGIQDYSREAFEYDYRLSVISCVFCPIVWKRAFSVRYLIQAYEDGHCSELLE